MEDIINRAPWNIDKQLLILVEGYATEIPPDHMFELIDC